MTATVSIAPGSFELESCFVKQPVSTAHLGRYAEEAAHIGGCEVNTIASCTIRNRGADDLTLMNPKHHPAAWMRSAGASVVRVETELYPFQTQGTCTIEVTLPTGAAWILHNGLDGSQSISPPPGMSVIPYSRVGWVDVTGCSLGDVLYWDAKIESLTGGVCSLSRVSLTEVPADSLDPIGETGSPAIDPAWTVAGNYLVDGGKDVGFGMARLAFVMDLERKHFRQHFQLVGVEADTSGALIGTWLVDGGITNGEIFWARPDNEYPQDGYWFFQPRGHFGTSVGIPYNFAVRYGACAVDCQIDVYLEGVGTFAGFWQTLVLPATADWTWRVGTVYVPCDGADGVVFLRFRATNPQASGTFLRFAAIALIESSP